MKAAEHRRKAGNNESFAQWVTESRPGSCDWSATAYFYTALHLMDDYLHRRGYECGTHKKREITLASLVQSNLFPSDQFEHYTNLYTLSISARYSQVYIDKAELQDAWTTDYAPLAEWLKQQKTPGS